jgi:transposase InsO family protein
VTSAALTPATSGPETRPVASSREAGTGHLERLQVLCPTAPAAPPTPPRRGSLWQQPRRRLEEQVRQQGAAFRQWVAGPGLTRQENAAWLGISARTLRDWEQRGRGGATMVPALGRPVPRSELAARQAVLELLAGVGPGVGLAVLAGQFPEMPRAELADLLRRYRHVWVGRHAQGLHVLHWQQAGAVWAIDYARPPLPLEEGYTDLLAVRDLASGMQLLWLPVTEATAATATAALLSLFMLYGAPLVLKLDNGSPFVAGVTRELVAQWRVIPLYSPPGRPQYNGAIEAGIGALKARTHDQAVRQGRPGEWTLADAETARQQANTLGRPWGARGPTPAERWANRQAVALEEREAFAASVARLEEEAGCIPESAPAGHEAAAAPGLVSRAVAESATAVGPPAEAPGGAVTEVRAPGQEATSGPHPAVPSGAQGDGSASKRAAREWAARQRQAIRRALVAHGYLLFTRRRIPLPIKKKKVT